MDVDGGSLESSGAAACPPEADTKADNEKNMIKARKKGRQSSKKPIKGKSPWPPLFGNGK